ncbi:MAG: hypothetical protein IJ297_07750 [Clostridia bacterium]|nr:hypothetical protein [Clostridia bacterium]
MFLLVAIVLVLFPHQAAEGAAEGLRFALERVIVAILPFSAISSAMVFSGYAQKIGKLASPIFIRLNLNPYGAIAYIAGLLGGYPTGCRTVCDMYREGLIDKADAESMLCYVNNGGLVFAMNVTGIAMWKDVRAGLYIFFVSAISALIASQLFNRGCRVNSAAITPKEKTPFWAALGRGIGASAGVGVNIVASFVVFYAIGEALNLEKVPFLMGVWDMTKGISYCAQLKNLPLAVLFFSFGGASVMAQSTAVLAECELSMRQMIKGKAASAAIAFLITYTAKALAGGIWESSVLAMLALIVIVVGIKLIKKLYAFA